MDRSLWSDAVTRLHELAGTFVAAVPAIVVGLLLLALLHGGGLLLRHAVRRYATRRTRQRNLALALGRLAHGAALVLGGLLVAVLVFPGFTPTSFLQFVGIGSIAAGFAFKEILQNYLAGIVLLLGESFRVGDQIVYGSFEGTVEEIQTRATLLRTYDSRRVVIPNGELFTSAVIVNTAFPARRLEYDVGIGFGDDVERAREVMLEAVRGAAHVLDEPAPEVLTFDIGESAVLLRVRWWVQPPRRDDELRARDAVLSAVKAALLEAGVDLPFPTRQVLFHDQTEEWDGDRRRQREGWPAGKGHVPRPRAVGKEQGASRPGEGR